MQDRERKGRGRVPTFRKIPKTEHPVIAASIAAGQTQTEVAAVYGVSPAAISYLVKKYGWVTAPSA